MPAHYARDHAHPLQGQTRETAPFHPLKSSRRESSNPFIFNAFETPHPTKNKALGGINDGNFYHRAQIMSS